MKRLRLAAFLLSLTFVRAHALDPQPDGLFVRVVDVGAGLCCVIKMPDNHCMVYDAGNFQDSGKTAFQAITNLIPKNSSIDYLVLSHTDSDHVAAVGDICKSYTLRNIVHPGLMRFNPKWQDAEAAIRREVKKDHAQELNLAKTALTPGQHFELGGVAVSFVCGFSKPPSDWDIADDSERYNAGSIVERLTFKGKSILFCGDAVGRHLDDPPGACINTEKFMVDHAATVPIAADVMIAPHHGSEGASSPDFIRAVRPHDVIFSAGHKFEHPRKSAVQRYLDFGITEPHLFRTDRGDNEGGKEWIQSPGNAPDPPGDDDVDVLITKSGTVTVAYRNN